MKTREAQYFANGRVLYGNAVLFVDIYTALPYMIDVHTVVETPTYLSQAKRAGVSDEELDAIAAYIAANPGRGDLIPGTGGARKVRFAPMGRGKRGGYRIIHFFAADDVPVFLLAILSKGQRADLTQAEKNDLRKILGGLADDYRATVREHTTRPRRP